MAISTRVYFAMNVTEIIFPFSSWLSFQRLCRLLWVLHLCAPYIFMIIYIFYINFLFQSCHRLIFLFIFVLWQSCVLSTVVLISEYEWINDCAAQPPSLQFPTVIPLGHAPTQWTPRSSVSSGRLIFITRLLFYQSYWRVLVAWHSGRTSVSDWRTFPAKM